MGSAIKVTVVVPTYNTSAGVVKNIESLLGQTLPRDEFEVIYVDDGSTDTTADVIAAKIAREPNFHLIRSTNSGWPGRPRNIGMDAAAGEFIFFADDDDWLAPAALEQLYNRAVTDEADITFGRIAGHGRGAHREVTQASMTGGDIRDPRHRVLLSSMTVFKLYRRAFLRKHGLRFEEGRVRLEDHLFSLRAYLRTRRVSIMHDRVVYHWVRNKKFGNNSFGEVDPIGYTDSIARIFEIVTDEIDDPATRDRFIRTWYRRKVLRHLPQTHFLEGSFDYADALVQANRKLIEEWIPVESDARLGLNLRIRAALFRLGDTDLARRWGRYERTTGLQCTFLGGEWDRGELVLRLRSWLATTPPGGEREPIPYVRRGGRVYRQLPNEFASVESIAAACDVTGELAGGRGRVFIRRRDPSGDVYLPYTSRMVEVPLGGDRFSVQFEVEVRLDPLTADQGHTLVGTWDFFAAVDSCGQFEFGRLRVDPEMPLPKRLLGGTGLVAKPVVTTRGNQSLKMTRRRVGVPGWPHSPITRTVRVTARRVWTLPGKARAVAGRIKRGARWS